MNTHETGRYPNEEFPSLRRITAIRVKAEENYAAFSEDDISAIRRDILQPIIDPLVKSLDRDELSFELAEMQKSLEPIRSPSQLTARFIIQNALRNMDRTLEEIDSWVEMSRVNNAEATGSFIIMCDFARGTLEVAESILAAEDYLAHGDHTLAKGISARGEAVRLPTAEQANLYIALGSYVKTYAGILQQDPSGFTLVDRAAKDTEIENETIENYRIPVVREFMIDGAKAGALMYKKLYPKAQKILQQ